MSGANSDQLHRNTLSVYTNLMEHFNPGLQNLVALGNSYVKAFQALSVTSEAYFSAVTKMGEQALHTISSRSLGDVLIQISETQRRLTAEIEGVFQWFHIEVLQTMDKNVKLDEEYIDGSRRVYELEVRNQAAMLERQLRRGAFRDSLESSDYMQYLRQSHTDILKEEERRFRFLAEKHCGLTQSLLFLINKTGSSLQQKVEGWKEKVNESKISRPRTATPTHMDVEAQLKSSFTNLLQTGEEREQKLPLGRVPSRGRETQTYPRSVLLCADQNVLMSPTAPSPLPSRSRSSSLGEALGVGSGQPMRALVSHPVSSNPVLLPFSRGECITVLLPEPRNGWLYGRLDGSLRQGWFPAAYVAPAENFQQPLGSSGVSHRSHSMNNLLEPLNPTEKTSQTDSRSFNEIPQTVTPVHRASVDFCPISPVHDRRVELFDNKVNHKSNNEILPSISPLRRGSADFRPVSPIPDRRADSHFDSKTEPKAFEISSPATSPPVSVSKSQLEARPISPLPAPTSERIIPHGQTSEHPLFPRGSNPFATVKLRPTTTNDRSAPRIH
ncbi:BAR/IMD domain-containing adapter protein 2-like 2 isoform X2 [Denticeps clupeoides]|nr:brain-specific angiogenesis inhibitor 1-associated protein 2-like protein 2 isoform X2 [Denticeps clupeoides]